MSSLAGGGAVSITADELIAGFRAGPHAGTTSHHMTTIFFAYYCRLTPEYYL
jgi:hypothetical protein